MSKQSVWTMAFLSLGIAFLSGCAGSPSAASASSSAPSPADVYASNMAGNWLMIGSLTSQGLTPTSGGEALTMTLDANGSQLSGTTSELHNCANVRFYGFSIGPDSVDQSGNFLLEMPFITIEGFVGYNFNGTAPSTPQGPWSGIYTIDANGCFGGLDPGTYAATSLANLTGTYTGSFDFFSENTSNLLPVSVAVNFQQGGTLSTGVFSNTVLTGTMTVSGTSCFSSGTTEADQVVAGASFTVPFTMNDGSTLEVIGSMEDVNADKLYLEIFDDSGGSCGELVQAPNSSLNRQ